MEGASVEGVLSVAIALILVVPLVILAYTSMERPRLRLVPADGGWRATRRDTVQYVASMVGLLILWWTLLAVILLLTARALDAGAVVVVSAGVVMAVRVLAHVRRRWAHELAKTVPMALVVVGIITRQTRSPDEVATIGLDLLIADLPLPETAALIAVELIAVSAWYWLGVRRLAPRGHNVPGIPAA